MPCNWFKLANIPLIRQQFKRNTFRECIGSLRTLPLSSMSFNLRCASSSAKASPPRTHLRPAFTTATAGDLSFKSSSQSREGPFIYSSSMTSAQISRAAAEAVRLCADDRQFTSALFVVNSLHQSMHQGTSTPSTLGPCNNQEREMEPIDFGRPVSPRLSAHCLVHALLRAGRARRAAILSEFMMQQGIPVRTATLEAIVGVLCQTPRTVTTAPQLPKSGLRPRNADHALRLVTGRTSNPNTIAAFGIIQSARKFGHTRTQKMYRSIVSTCLMQGEIIVASLLFVLLVKDWQAKTKRLQRLSSDVEGALQSSARDEPRGHRLQYPPEELMHSILRRVEDAYPSDLSDPMQDAQYQDSIQALASLAMLVEQGRIHTGRLSPIIRALYNCPKTRHKIWITRGEKAIQVQAYPYFQRILMRIIGSFKANRSTLKLPTLDLRSYNALLFYALRHRFSPALASEILDHMCIKRSPPLEPDIVTINTILRSGTLLRKYSIADAILAAIGGKEEFRGAHPGVQNHLVEHADADSSAGPILPVFAHSNFTKALRALEAQGFHLPDAVLAAFASMKADSHTLVAYLGHLVSSGSPRVVGILLFHFLPELHIVDHPSSGPLKHRPTKTSKEARLKRAVTYGPRFFSSVINALAKAGQTGLAERVWILANQAQRASWVPGFVPDVKPWCLPIHAYTSMMQCYAAEASKGVPRLFRGKSASLHNDLQWKPRSQYHVRGWANFILNRQKFSRGCNRSSAGRRMGLLLFRSMVSGGRDIYKSLSWLDKTISANPALQLAAPSPDPRFFNAALDLFSRRPHMIARAKRGSRSRWKRRLRFSRLLFDNKGEVQRSWSPHLQEIVDAMVTAGHPVPIGFRHLFLGRWLAGLLPRPDRPVLNQSPYAFPPPKTTFRPHGLPTFKTRGLPLGRRRYRGRRRNIHE